jgi:hypothetical protein
MASPPVSLKASPAIRGVVKTAKGGGTTLNGVSNKKRDRNPPVITGPNSPAILENGTAVATYTADEPVTWSLSGGVDAARFTLAGGLLSFRVAPNFEAPTDADANNVYRVVVRATDTAGNDTDRAVSVTVTDADEIPPVITGFATPSVAENTTAVATYTANEPVTWCLNGGADAARFTLTGG